MLMRTNSRVTIWHRTDAGYSAMIADGWWEDTEATNIRRTGTTSADTARVLLPLNVEISTEDYISKGGIPYVGTLTAAELVKRCSPLKVLTVTRHDYGSYYMRHTEVTAR